MSTLEFSNYRNLAKLVQFSHFGLISSETPATISFLENRKFLNLSHYSIEIVHILIFCRSILLFTHFRMHQHQIANNRKSTKCSSKHGTCRHLVIKVGN